MVKSVRISKENFKLVKLINPILMIVKEFHSLHNKNDIV